jgi:hypothetical protein
MAIQVLGTTVIDDSRNIQNIGVITATTINATTFVGSGSGLTGAGSTVFNNTTTNQEFFPLFTSTTSGTITASGISTSKLKYNPSTGTVTATAFIGSGSGLTGAGSTVFINNATNQEFFPLFTETTSGTITASGISTTKLKFNPSTGTVTATAFIGSGAGLTGAGSTVADDTSTNATFYPVLTQTTSGTITASKVSTTKLTFNPSTGMLTVGIVSATGIGTFGTNGTGARTIQLGGTASGGSSGDIFYIY